MASPAESQGAAGHSFGLEEARSPMMNGESAKVVPIDWKNWTNLVAYILNTIITYTSISGAFGASNTELSDKYQTLVTPAGWAFSIWGPIFIWEGVFVVAQLFPAYRQSMTTELISPWWWGVCSCQSAWTLAFAQELITLALVLMLGILACLLGVSWSTDGLQMSTSEYFLLRAPLSLQLGWIIAASAVSVNVLADSLKSSQETLLALDVLSTAAVLAIVTVLALAGKTADPIVALVAVWAFAGIRSSLADPTKLNEPTRFNPSMWDSVILGGLEYAALGVCLLSAAIAAAAVILRAVAGCQSSS